MGTCDDCKQDCISSERPRTRRTAQRRGSRTIAELWPDLVQRSEHVEHRPHRVDHVEDADPSPALEVGTSFDEGEGEALPSLERVWSRSDPSPGEDSSTAHAEDEGETLEPLTRIWANSGPLSAQDARDPRDNDEEEALPSLDPDPGRSSIDSDMTVRLSDTEARPTVSDQNHSGGDGVATPIGEETPPPIPPRSPERSDREAESASGSASFL